MEKETEAIASELSSLDMDDKFSTLPDHINHRILSFLPCIKDVARTSVISKSWLHAWRTFPIPEFDLEDFVTRTTDSSPDEDKAKMKQFIRFVSASLRRFGSQNGDDGMKSFNLTTTNRMRNPVNRWVGMALDNRVQALYLRIYADGSLLRCSVPERLFSVDCLKSLSLFGLIDLPLTENISVCLSSLTSLCLRHSTISDEQLRKLIHGCPILKDLDLLCCESLSEVEIFDHPDLESLEVTVTSTTAKLSAIRVRARNLKIFGYKCESLYKRNVVIKVHNSPDLRCLKIRDWNKTDEWLHRFLGQFPLLESLKLDWCNALKRIRISNRLLKTISLDNCNHLEDVLIDCKEVSSLFSFFVHTTMPRPSIRMDSPPDDCKAQIITLIQCDLLLEANWYCKLKEFLTRSITYKCLNFYVQAVSSRNGEGDMMTADVHKKLPSSACIIEQLTLGVAAPTSSHSCILNGLLSTCHPTIIKLDGVSKSPFVKLVCKELADKGGNCKCWCKDDFKCWKHQLKGVKIERIKGMKKFEGALDWDALFSLLPTLKVDNDIFFRLQWWSGDGFFSFIIKGRSS